MNRPKVLREHPRQPELAPGLMVITAHPDDETFGAGGSLALAVRAGARTAILLATSGQAGQIVPEALDTPENRADMGALREREAVAAAAELGVADLRLLGHADGALAGVDPQQLAFELAAHIRDFQPDVIVTFGPDGIYGHPDHVAISAATTQAFDMAADRSLDITGRPPHAARRLFFKTMPLEMAEGLNEERGPVDLEGDEHPFVGFPMEEIDSRIDISEVLEDKLRALAGHASQTGGDAEQIREQFGHRLGAEHFRLAKHRGPDPKGIDADLLAGLW